DYPNVPAEGEVLLPAAVLAAEPSLSLQMETAGWESRRFAERSAPLSPPTVTYSRTRGDAESKQEVGVHLPVGTWLQQSRSLAADSAGWGTSERQIVELQATRRRLIAYSDAVASKVELAQAMDRLEALKILEELTRRQREIAAVPESELLNLRIERFDADDAVATARETALRATERLAVELSIPIGEAANLQRRLPLKLPSMSNLPETPSGGRLDVKMAEDALQQQRSSASRARMGTWLSGLEVGLLQERTGAGQQANTVELSWRLPFGGEESRQADLNDRLVRQAEFQLRGTLQNVDRELAESSRAKVAATKSLELATQALKDAEAWMEEQVYRYSGMLIGPHDLLRAAGRLRTVRSRYVAAERGAFVADLDAHFSKTIPIQSAVAASVAPAATPAGATH
ncbi:MAG TPA: TolC family protein, partial [Burkholderiales bacterium]